MTLDMYPNKQLSQFSIKMVHGKLQFTHVVGKFMWHYYYS